MSTQFEDKVVISLGGSLVTTPHGIDTEFLTRFNSFIRKNMALYPKRQFFLVVGGGTTARQYRDAGKEVVGQLTDDDLDWLGIHASRLNAHLVRTIFRDIAHPVILSDFDIILKPREQLVVAAGWRPGWSTDYCAVMLCDDYDARMIVNMSNIDTVFDKDPREFPDAKPLTKIEWSEFQPIVGDQWKPGMNAPFDPIASKRASEMGVTVVVLNGRNLDNLQNYFAGKSFTGTVIG